jgi:hypothetical protein
LSADCSEHTWYRNQGHSVKKEEEFLEGAECLSLSLFKVLGDVNKCAENMKAKASKKKLQQIIKLKQSEVDKEIRRCFEVSLKGVHRLDKESAQPGTGKLRDRVPEDERAV